MVRSKIHFQLKLERAKLVNNAKKSINLPRLREMKQTIPIRDKIRYTELCKNIRKRMRNEIREYNIKIVEQAILANKDVKAARRKVMYGKKLMVAIKDNNGNIVTDRGKIVQRCAEFYGKLYSSTIDRPTISRTHRDPVPQVTCSEVENALKYMSNGKAPGPDGLVIELIKESGPEVWKRLAALFSKCRVKYSTI